MGWQHKKAQLLSGTTEKMAFLFYPVFSVPVPKKEPVFRVILPEKWREQKIAPKKEGSINGMKR